MTNIKRHIKDLIYFLSFYLRPHPFYLIFFVTKRCNSRCVTCFHPENQGGEYEDLSLPEIRAFASQTPPLFQLNLTGGEPTLRDDLPEIISVFQRYTGIRHVTLTSNGMLPDKTVNICREIGSRCPKLPFRITISLDGLETVHNRIRGVKDGFQKATRTIRGLLELHKELPHLRVAVNSVYCHQNQDHFPHLVDYLHKNFPLENHLLLWPRGNPRDPSVMKVEFDTFVRVKSQLDRYYTNGTNQGYLSRVFNELDKMVGQSVIETIHRNRLPSPCRAGRRMIVIDAVGNVQICEPSAYQSQGRSKDLTDAVPLDESRWQLGSLRENDYSIRNILALPETKKKIRTVQKNCCYCTYECARYASILSHLPSVMKILFNCCKFNRNLI
jgi:MoaA/NifB/PqqE/SkfB family radical SAM enzyme